MTKIVKSIESPLRIGALAEQSGCSVPTIRYYEQIGLIPRAARRSSGHRIYDASAAARLALIRRCREFGFSIGQTRELIGLTEQGNRDCVDARDIAQAQLSAVRAKMLELMSLERSLAGFVESCTAACAGGPAPECTIFRDLQRAEARDPKPACCG